MKIHEKHVKLNPAGAADLINVITETVFTQSDIIHMQEDIIHAREAEIKFIIEMTDGLRRHEVGSILRILKKSLEPKDYRRLHTRIQREMPITRHGNLIH